MQKGRSDDRSFCFLRSHAPCTSAAGTAPTALRHDLGVAVGICRVVNAQALATEMASVKGEAAGRGIAALRIRTAGSPCRWRGSGSDCAGRPAGRLGLWADSAFPVRRLAPDRSHARRTTTALSVLLFPAAH